MLSIQQDQASGAGSSSWLGTGLVPMGFPVWFWQAAWLGWFRKQALPAWNASPGRTADSERDSSSQHPLLKGAVREGS